MTTAEIAAIAARYNSSVRTVHRWIARGAPIHDARAMDDWITAQRSRRGVSKYKPRTEEAQLIEAQPIEITVDTSALDVQPAIDSPLARLEAMERATFAKCQQTGLKSDIATWIAVNEALRRTQETLSQTKQIAAHDGKLVSAILELIENWSIWFEVSMAKIVPMLCEGIDDRATVTEKLKHHFGLILYHAFADTHALVRDTPLEEIWRQYMKQKLGGKDPEDV